MKSVLVLLKLAERNIRRHSRQNVLIGLMVLCTCVVLFFSASLASEAARGWRLFLSTTYMGDYNVSSYPERERDFTFPSFNFPRQFIPEESMTKLLDSDLYATTTLLLVDEEHMSRADVTRIHDEAVSRLREHDIAVRSSTTIYRRLDEMDVFVKVFAGVRVIFLGIMFVLLGAALCAIAGIYTFKRRREIWTYAAMGLRDRQVSVLMMAEYLFLALAGTSAGIALGALSSAITERSNIWLQFSYLPPSPLMAQMGVPEVLIILTFVSFCVVLWTRSPLRRVLLDRPFSY